MDPRQPLAPCMISTGTLSHPRDMLRALETLENLDYQYTVDNQLIEEGRAALVKLMADPESATLVVNGCIFLNVSSFRFLDFSRDAEDRWSFTLHGDGSTLHLVAIPETEEDEESAKRPHLLSEEIAQDFESLIALDDDEDEE